MTPFLRPANAEQLHYNKMHKTTRSKVENCIGTLKQRFRCLLGERKLLYSHERAADIIVSCVVLHNYVRAVFNDDDVADVQVGNLNAIVARNVYLNVGRDVRNRLAHQLHEDRQE